MPIVCSVTAGTLSGALTAAVASQFSSAVLALLIAMRRLSVLRTAVDRTAEELVRWTTRGVEEIGARLVLPPCSAPLHEQLQRSVRALLHRLVCAIIAASELRHDHMTVF